METDDDGNDGPWMRLGYYKPNDQSVSELRFRREDIGAYQDAETTFQIANNFLRKNLWAVCRSFQRRISFKIS